MRCAYCNGEFTPKSPRQRFCSLPCSATGGRRERKAKRQARIREGDRTITLRQVYETDNGRCCFCGEPVPWIPFDGRNPQSPTIEHVIPFAHGGKHERGNVRLAHLGCNSKAGSAIRPQAPEDAAPLSA